ncbi:T9SS type A sorting domain-containing protein, partial [bacterium]|nr:T9SS type A sorting domain-containing protein [bacterium]
DGVDNDCDGVIDGLRIRITDIGDDQGRVVRVNWTRHGEDAPGTEYDVTGYTLYRRIDDAKASAAPVKAAPPGLWDYVNTIPAHGEDQYFVLAPTLGDSTSHDIVWSVFFLRAETTDPLVFFDSAPDSGYSVDNLAPPAPSGLQAASVPGGTSLTWIESQVPDLFYYRVYRGATPDFPLTVDTLVYFTTGLAWLDPQTDPARPFYKVTALDITGNESPAAVVESTTGAGDATPLAAVLHPNRPNPFNPTTTFAFEVPRDDRVTLTIHALDGRVVAQLVDDVLAAGSHTATWRGAYDDGRAAPSGVYLARYVTGGVSTSRRVMLVR